MYISDLTLHGFKSFAKKDKLQFGEGITAIVGPNGCGKTNIVDAIRWVLGEQKTSVLRGVTMQDIIFNGAEKQKPLGVCEVSLTVHNNKGKLPVEYNDVEISRRVFRSGESEYYINRNKCRRKDVYDLFVDTGMGSDAYSVIELKMIEQILSDTADDRKRMFEEAAGINKYKGQRKAALRKFEQTRLDFERVEDIITEVEAKVHSLELQLKRYKRHEKLTDRVKDAEIALAYLKTREYEERAHPLRKKIENFKHLRESKANEESIHERELKTLEGGYKEQQSEVESIRKEIAGLDSRREEQANSILVSREQSRASEASIQRLELEQKSNTTRREQMKTQIAEYAEEIQSINPVVEEKLNAYKTEKNNLEKVEKDFKKSRQDLDRILTKRWETERDVADRESLLERTRSKISEETSGTAELEKKLRELGKDQKADRAGQKKLEAEKEKFREEIDDQKKRLKTLELEASEYQEARHELTLKHHGTLAQAEGLESQLQFYRELVSRGEGYPEGARYVLDHAEEFSGILGTVADLIQVDEKYKAAVETGLGEFASCLVAKDRTSAVKVLNKIHDQDLGEVSIIPLKEVTKIKISQLDLSANNQVIGRAADLVRVKKDIQPLTDRLLGRLLIVSDLNKSLKIGELNGWDLVDLSGAFAGRNLILKNKGKSESTGLLGRKKQIELLNEKIEVLVKKGQGQREELEELDRKRGEADAKSEALSGEIQEHIENLTGIETELIRNHYRQTQVLEAIKGVNTDLAETKKSISEMNRAVDRLEPKIADTKTKLDNISEKVETAKSVVDEAQKRRDGFHQRVQDMRIELLNLENNRDNLNFQKRTAQEMIAELKERYTHIDTEIESFRKKIADLLTDTKTGESDLLKVKGQIQKQHSILDLKRTATGETYRRIEEIRALIRGEQQERESILEELKQCEVEIAEFEQKIASQKDRIREKYDLEIPNRLEINESADDLAFRIDRFRRSIENIGPINMAVKDEHEEESQRLNMLNEQRDDLTAAEQNLQETIQKIDKVARQQFRDTFDLIKENFEKLFTMFFEGGKGQLELSGDPDPLEADIAIHAQPPGKRNQSLRMLSAGEKALTAIALLFSIYQVKPSPYCILDEVDAPLDDVNIKKFTRVLQKFADETQFIVVTHNKLTMESADYLYGVTMEKKGVSKLVSVKFEA